MPAPCPQAWGDHCAPGAGIGPVGDFRLLPAPDAQLPCTLPWYPSHATAICELHESPGAVHA